MSKRPFFSQHFGSQRVNAFQTQLKSSRHHIHSTVSLIWDKRSSKKSLLVISEILGLFVNTLTVDGKYSRQNIENFPQIIEFQSSQRQETFSGFFVRFLKSTSNSEYFKIKDESQRFKYFGNYWLQKRGLLKCLKGAFFGNLLAVNLLTGPNHCWNLHGTIFTILPH